MKVIQIFIVLATFFIGGCASGPDGGYGDEATRITPVEPPAFMNAHVAGLFGEANFSARVEVQKGIPGTRPPMVGQLFGRNGSLFFAEAAQRGKDKAGGELSVLWDRATQTAYLLDEPLQGYAPIRNVNTNAALQVTVIGEENVGAEPARKSILQRVVGAELTPVLIVWRGSAQQELPLKIQMTNSPGAVTLTLSRIQFETPPADLFALPNGFKKYESTDAMITELVQRRRDLISARSKKNRERYGLPTEQEEETTRSMEKPVRPY